MRWVLGIGVVVVAWLATLASTDRPRADRALASPSFRAAPPRAMQPVDEAPRIGAPPPRTVDGSTWLHTHPTFRETLREVEKWPRGSSDQLAEPQIREALKRTDEPVQRQYLIFLAVRMMDPDRSATLLRELDGHGDEEDAIVALAFNGDKEAIEEFKKLAERPSRANVAILVDTLAEIERIERMGGDDARDLLRSYRAFEVLTRKFYFRIIEDNIEVPYEYRPGRCAESDAELVSLWLARYPGHPGSDDAALLAGENYFWESASAAPWLNRASVLPDQRRTSRALRRLLGHLDCATPKCAALIDELLKDPDVPNRILLEYVRVRGIAVESGFRAALAEMPSIARRYPGSSLAVGWAQRAAASRPEAEDVSDRLGHLHDRVAAHRSPVDRLSPPREAMQLSSRALAFQFRCWERLAEFEAVPQRPETRVRMAEFLLAHPESIYPVYAIRSGAADQQVVRGDSVHAWRRVLQILPEGELEDPSLASRAALVRWDAQTEALRYLALEHVVQNEGERAVRAHLEKIVDGYDGCARAFPNSPEAAVALERAAYWRGRIQEVRRE